MIDTAGRLDRKLKAEGLAIVGVSIGNSTDTTTWRVQPSELQAQAQPFIDAVDVAVWEQDEVWAELRVDRNTRLIASDWTQLPDVSCWICTRGQRRMECLSTSSSRSAREHQ